MVSTHPHPEQYRKSNPYWLAIPRDFVKKLFENSTNIKKAVRAVLTYVYVGFAVCIISEKILKYLYRIA